MLAAQLNGREYRYDKGLVSYAVRHGQHDRAWMFDPAVYEGGLNDTEKKSSTWPWIVGLAVAISIAGLVITRTPRGYKGF